MKKVVVVAMLGLLFAVGSAVGQDVRYNFDKNTDFTKFKTYKWVAVKDAEKVDDLLDKQIKAIVTSEMATKGFTQVEDDSANILLAYQVAIGQEKQFSSYNTDWGYGGGWNHGGWYGGGMGTSTTTGQTETIYIGQLALDMYDSANHDLVWRGLASKTIDKKAKPDKQEKNLTKAVAKLLKNYPPKVKE